MKKKMKMKLSSKLIIRKKGKFLFSKEFSQLHLNLHTIKSRQPNLVGLQSIETPNKLAWDKIKKAGGKIETLNQKPTQNI